MQVRNDELLKWAIGQYSELADQGTEKSITTGLMATVPSLLSTSFYFVDVITDFILTADYRRKSQNRMEWENNVLSYSALFSSAETNIRRRMFHLEIVES